jgi:hypothetical protein
MSAAWTSAVVMLGLEWTSVVALGAAWDLTLVALRAFAADFLPLGVNLMIGFLSPLPLSMPWVLWWCEAFPSWSGKAKTLQGKRKAMAAIANFMMIAAAMTFAVQGLSFLPKFLLRLDANDQREKAKTVD